MILQQFYLGCLAHASYLVGDEETRVAAVIDPQRDIDRYVAFASEHRLEIKHVFLTHLHADFVAGHLEFRNRFGATIYLGKSAKAEYAFVPVGDGDVVQFGKVRIAVLETPGHTVESISLVVYDLAASDTVPQGVLTGDTLFVGDVGRPDRSGQAAPTPAAPHRGDADDRRGLEVIRRRVPAGTGELDQGLDRRGHGDDLRRGRAAAAHRHDDDVPIACEQAREMPGDGGLADPLARSGDRDRRDRDRGSLGWVEAEVGADVRNGEREHPAHEGEPLGRAEHGLVGQVDDDVGRVPRDCGLDVRKERDAVVLPAAQLLLPADEDSCDELVGQLRERVADDRGVMLAVDDRDRPHVRAVTSSSIEPVNFAYSSVSSEKETRRSWPWKGWRRHTFTRPSSISIRL